MSYGEDLLSRYLMQLLPYKCLRNFRPDWLLGMELDFYFPDQLVAVEFQGDHHYCPTDYCADHNSVQRRDRLKRQICRSRGINVVIVDAVDLIQHRLRAKLKQAVKRIRPRVRLEKVDLRDLDRAGVEYRRRLIASYDSPTARMKGRQSRKRALDGRMREPDLPHISSSGLTTGG